MAESSDILVSGLAGGGGAGGGGIAELSEDLTPQLGGDLDLNGNVITGLVIGTDVQAHDAKLTDIAGKIRQSGVDTTFAIDFTEATNNGTNYTRLHGANGIGANVDIQLPDASGFLVRYEDIGTLMQAYDADTAKTDVVQAYTAQQNFSQATLTSTSNSIAWDLNTGQTAKHTATEDTTLANPTNQVAGATYQFTFIQHASAAKTLAFGANYKFSGSSTVSATLSSVAIFTFTSDGTYMRGVMTQFTS